MNIATYIQRFENSLSSYTGDDLLDPWDKFVEFLEQKLPGGGGGEMLQVLDTLVQRFLGVDRYANDIRFVNYCIRCASYCSDPIALYSLVFSKGVGTRTAALYVAWAQQCEQKGMNEQADAVYQKAVENQAQPADTVLHEYRQFQSRTQLPVPGGRALLQDSQLTNQMPSHSVTQNKPSDWLLRYPAHRMVTTVSRSETSGTLPPSSGLQTVSQYTKDVLVCEGSEFCFEEVRAEKYFRQLREKQEKEQREIMEKQLRQQEDRVQRMKCLLEEVNQELETRAGFTGQTSSQQLLSAGTASNPPQSFAHHRASNRLSSRRSLGLRLQTEPTFIHKAPAVPDHLQELSEESQHPSVLPEPVVQQPVSLDQMNSSLIRTTDVLHQSSSDSRGPSELSATHLDRSRVPEPEDKLDVSQGGIANASHVTPNNSLGFVQATPSRALPSPTVNTREALGVIMDMFQAPTFLEEPFSSTSVLHAAAERDCDVGARGGVSSVPKPPAATPFTIYQDDDKENCSSAALPDKHKPVRALAEVSVPKADKPNETGPDLMPDESTMWGPRYNSLAACPNSTTDFALLAQFVSTPFTSKTPFNTNVFQDQESTSDGGEADENVFIRRQTKKLSPIMEQSPSDNKGSESAVGQLPPSVQQGTIVGEGLTTTSTTLMQPPPPAALSFRDQTLCPTESSRSAALSFRDQTLCPTESSRSAALSFRDQTLCPTESSRSAALSFRDQTLCPTESSRSAALSIRDQTLCPTESSRSAALSIRDQTLCPTESSRSAALSFRDQTLCPTESSRSAALSIRDQTFCPTESSRSAALSFRDQTFCPTESSRSAALSFRDQTLCPTESSRSAALSIRDQTFCPTESSRSAALSIRDQTFCPTESSRSAALSFRDQTLCPTESSRSTERGWEVYTSPGQPPNLDPPGSFRPQTEPFKILEDLQKPASPEPDHNLDCDVPMSPEFALKSSWLQVRNPETAAEQDLDAYLSPCRPKTANETSTRLPDVPMSPEQPGFCADVPMSPQQTNTVDEPMMMSPDRGPRPTAGVQLVPDPWDSDLISDLLSRLNLPLTSDPRCFTWQVGVPRITPKVTISVGKASLRVDRVLGEGAFATVYQATDPVTSEKMVLKVQKPANPWEFYINTQLDARLQPRLRHLFSSVRSAHLFHDGSVLVDELHNYGTLLNVVNIYRSQCAKVMPQPLVLYFTVCILQMVEQLHAARIVHADIKPDNFLLGERFLENECLDSENPDHGLVLIDLGQSIDMTLFPEGTAFTARCLTSGFQCTEMLSGKPWTYQTDYFGMAGTVYCMMFGTYMRVTNQGGVWRTNGQFRRIPHSDMWLDFFHTLLNVPDCRSLPSLQNLRQKLDSVLQENYSNKLPALKRRLVVQLLERR